MEKDFLQSKNYQRLLRELSELDGDTLHLVAEQGFYSQYRLTVRLRGLNTAELDGPDSGRASDAQKFVIQTLKDLEFILIKTYKTDSFGRYIADVFYHPLWKDHLKIFTKGYFLNQQLLDRGLARLAAY